MKKELLLVAAGALALTLVTSDSLAQQPAQPGRGGGRGAAPAPAPLPQNSPIIKIKQGQVQGGTVNGVNVYRGIPFAQPPVGDLRWKAPVPAKGWSGVKAAVNMPSACTAAEDCLYVNVFTPESAKAGQKLPVMVWIYGGAFTGGSNALYDGTQFAKQGVIFVALNYRLGRAGWFAHPALTKEAGKGPNANYGLMDQIEALRWVQANIGAFGGDNKNVTIFGESAGAISVNYLMLAPEARGLFQKAIAESGFGRLVAKPLKGAGSAEETGQNWAKSVGITGDDAAAAKAMRALSFEDLRKGPLPLGSVGPIADGHLITGTSVQEFAQGKEAKVPYILGGNSDEASLTRSTTNVAQRMTTLGTDGLFTTAFGPTTPDANRAVGRLVTDELISEPDRALARIHSKVAPTWVYHFSYTPMAQRASVFGLPHGGEIAYVYDTPRREPFDAQGASIAKSANAYWVAFAKTGDPGSAGGPAWPKWDNSGEKLMEFGPEGSPHVDEHFHKARLDFVESHAAK
ncbi:MAG TPA: carboxylesterase family protein [Caulobacteraceae bacterium]|nr:carboxylesterase family protein [Caulobacteraceae bacterium]